MYVVETKEVSYEQAVQLINETIAERGLTRDDLVNLLGYYLKRKGLEELDRFFSGSCTSYQEWRIREKIGTALQMDRLRLLGEYSFETEEEANRFVFRPHLLRIPELTRPTQIGMLPFVGMRCILVTKVYDELLGKPLEEQLKHIKDDVLNDSKKFDGKVLYFGKKLGYAYYWDFEQPAVPLSLQGEVLEDMIVTDGSTCSYSLSIKAKDVIRSGYFSIPRLSPRPAPDSGV